MVKRRQFTAEFKARVALEALRDKDTIHEIAGRHEVHPNQVGLWKRQAVNGLSEVFSKSVNGAIRARESKVRDLHAKIGELTVINDHLAKGLKR